MAGPIACTDAQAGQFDSVMMMCQVRSFPTQTFVMRWVLQPWIRYGLLQGVDMEISTKVYLLCVNVCFLLKQMQHC